MPVTLNIGKIKKADINPLLTINKYLLSGEILCKFGFPINKSFQERQFGVV